MEGERFFLYRYDGEIAEAPQMGIKKFSFGFWHPIFHCMCKAKKTKEYNDFYTELRWMIATCFRLKIYYIERDNILIHSSFCTPKTFKFPFFKTGDVQIGPCFTDPAYRGQGIYPTVLKYIADDLTNMPKYGKMYMIIEENNKSSREGVKKAGFSEVAELYRKGRLRKYYVKQWL